MSVGSGCACVLHVSSMLTALPQKRLLNSAHRSTASRVIAKLRLSRPFRGRALSAYPFRVAASGVEDPQLQQGEPEVDPNWNGPGSGQLRFEYELLTDEEVHLSSLHLRNPVHATLRQGTPAAEGSVRSITRQLKLSLTSGQHISNTFMA